MLSAKGVSAVKKALKKKGPLSVKDLEPFVENLTARQPFSKEQIGVTDAGKFLGLVMMKAFYSGMDNVRAELRAPLKEADM